MVGSKSASKLSKILIGGKLLKFKLATATQCGPFLSLSLYSKNKIILNIITGPFWDRKKKQAKSNATIQFRQREP